MTTVASTSSTDLRDHLSGFQQRLVDRMWRAFGIVALLGLANNVIAMLTIGWKNSFFVNIVVTVVVITANVFLTKIPVKIKIYVMLLLLLLMGLGNFPNGGMFGAGWYWFVVFSLLAAVFHSVRIGITGMVMFGVLLAGVGFSYVTGSMGSSFDLNVRSADPGAWINFFTVVILASSILLYAIGGYLSEIRKLLDEVGTQRNQSELLRQQAEQARTETEQAFNNLRSAQAKLVQSEKMAALGQLVANVSHEINSPIGAVKSSGKSIADSLDHALESMPSLFQILDQDERNLFMKLISHHKDLSGDLSSREFRTLVNEVARQLEEAGIEHGLGKASVLVELNAHATLNDYLPLLRHPECATILDTAKSVATISSGTENINAAVDRVSKIVFALKSFSSLNSSGKRVEADLVKGIESVLTLYQNQIKNRIEVVRQYDNIPSVYCMIEEMNQVWTNLILNALQAMPDKGVLTIGIRHTGKEAIVSIRDSGCGIPLANQGKIFDAFFTTKSGGEGAGLGLDIVKRIIEQHKGRIEFESEEGRGTVFTVCLPCELRKQARASN